MRRAALILGMCGACAGRHRAAEPLDPPDPAVGQLTPTDEVRAIDTRTEVMKRTPTPEPKHDRYADPDVAELIAQIDPHDYERWPLTPNQHPALEPTYAIANVFASPGVSWLDLCAMGAQNRRGAGNPDQLEYLRGWCDVAKRDAAAAVVRLEPLLRSTVLGMPAAVRSDIANIVVDGGDATFAQNVLSRAQIDDLAIFDLVAAGYVEVGKVPDALELTDRGIAAHDQRRPATHCKRLARKATLVPQPERMPVISQLDGLQDCGAIYAELVCWHARHCDPYLIAHGIDPDQLDLGAFYKTWPKPGASVDEWLGVAKRATASFRFGYAEVVARALEAGLRSIRCTGPEVREFVAMATDLSRRTQDKELVDRFRRIAFVPDSVCDAS